MNEAWTKVTRGFVLAAATALSVTVGVTPTDAVAADKIAVATGIDPAFAHFHIAKEAGLWQKHGLDVDVRLFPTGVDAIASVITGSAVAAIAAEVPCILAATKSPKMVLAALAHRSDKIFGVVSRSEIHSPQDLKGKKFATVLGSGAHFWADAFLKHNKMTAHDVQLINVDPPEMVAALNRGDIAAYASWEPWITRVLKMLGDKVRVLQRSEGIFHAQGWFCLDRDWALKNADQARRFMQGLLDADGFIKKNPAAAGEIVARALKIELTTVKEAMALSTFEIVITDQMMEQLVNATNWLVSIGRMKPPPDYRAFYKAFVYPDPLRAVKPEAARFRLPGG